jgi:hypothetical protein
MCFCKKTDGYCSVVENLLEVQSLKDNLKRLVAGDKRFLIGIAPYVIDYGDMKKN